MCFCCRDWGLIGVVAASRGACGTADKNFNANFSQLEGFRARRRMRYHSRVRQEYADIWPRIVMFLALATGLITRSESSPSSSL